MDAPWSKKRTGFRYYFRYFLDIILDIFYGCSIVKEKDRI